MNIVLLSGGSGKRLWPLSNDMLSKQFLKLLKNERGEYESMAQRVLRQITSVYPDANVLVSGNASQADMLQRHLDEVEAVLEPSRRDTFPAISLAAAHLHYKRQLGENEVFLACPIDVFANQGYFELLADVAELVSSDHFELGLLGAIPTYASEKYGYILRKHDKVCGYIEKPTAVEAEKLISQGALWNCGVFALKIGYVLRHAREYVDFECFETLLDQYRALPKISFDYEVVEKEASIGAVEYDGVWKDLGTWNTLTEEMGDNAMGSSILISEDCVNTHVFNMLNIPVIAQDLNDMIVVASYDGILVSSKQGSSYLKQLAENVDLRPMYEQRCWGNYRVLEYRHSDNAASLVKRLHIDAGQTINSHYDSERCEVWTVVSGKGILTIDGVDSVVSAGSVVSIPARAKHSLLAATDLEIIEVQIGTGDLCEEDTALVAES